MPLHVLYSPAHSDFVRDVSGKPVTTEKSSPTRADAPAGSPAGTHWMQVTDDIDGTGPAGSHLGPANKLGTPEIVLRGMHAVRLFPLVRK
jgi:hypothetical protein